MKVQKTERMGIKEFLDRYKVSMVIKEQKQDIDGCDVYKILITREVGKEVLGATVSYKQTLEKSGFVCPLELVGRKRKLLAYLSTINRTLTPTQIFLITYHRIQKLNGELPTELEVLQRLRGFKTSTGYSQYAPITEENKIINGLFKDILHILDLLY